MPNLEPHIRSGIHLLEELKSSVPMPEPSRVMPQIPKTIEAPIAAKPIISEQKIESDKLLAEEAQLEIAGLIQKIAESEAQNNRLKEQVEQYKSKNAQLTIEYQDISQQLQKLILEQSAQNTYRDQFGALQTEKSAENEKLKEELREQTQKFATQSAILLQTQRKNQELQRELQEQKNLAPPSKVPASSTEIGMPAEIKKAPLNMRSFTQEILNIFDESLAEQQARKVNVAEKDKLRIEQIYGKVKMICNLLQEFWKDEPDKLRNISPILENISILAGKADQETTKILPSFNSEQDALIYITNQFKKGLKKNERTSTTLESFSKGDIPVIAELYDKSKAGMQANLVRQIENELQELFPLADLEEIKVVPYQTTYDARFHDLVKLERAPSVQRVIPKSTILHVEARGYKYKAQVHIKPKIIVAE